MQSHSLFDPAITRRAALEAFTKLSPRVQLKNPVMFIVAVGAVLSTLVVVRDVASGAFSGFNLQITLWLWFTVLFANFAEAIAEGRGKAQADALRKTRTGTMARLLTNYPSSAEQRVGAASLKVGDIVICEAGDVIPGDGEVVKGIASVNESAITGESAPVIREAGGDRSAVTGGTQVISDCIYVRITTEQGTSFLDRMIALVEGAQRQKTPNEIALSILLAALSIVFLLAVVTLKGFAQYSETASGLTSSLLSVPVLIALLVCLIPTTIGGLLSAIGISGMDRLIQRNVIATSGRAVEAAGDVDVLLLDKTGTITLGNRMASEFVPAQGIDVKRLAEAAQLSSLADETPEGRSIVVLAKEKFGIRGQDGMGQQATFIPFTAQTRMSGVDLGKRSIRKGASDTMMRLAEEHGAVFPQDVKRTVEDIAKTGGTPLVVAVISHSSLAIGHSSNDSSNQPMTNVPMTNQPMTNDQSTNDQVTILGVIHLKDIVKGGIKERFAELRKAGIKTVMITGDNPLTAAAIAAEAGVDDYIAEATPETKLKRIRDEQAAGHLVAMVGDGTNDAPALAQADVGVAMNSGTQAAREAGNMVDLDNNPTKLLEVVEIGKQLLMTRGALTTFSIANDIAKYFAIIPAIFATLYATKSVGALSALNIMQLATPESAILSAIIFNALVIVALIPIALRGVPYQPLPASTLLWKNFLIYGVGGVLVPFVGIKAIDVIIVALHLV
ncbi:MAG: potassium-transporting ATPase subunit KdpB [Candidatus Kapabacteria bacterium]|jgi:K+-transporting ATPase ATPase B chain|nr:potassium-transporting ATPase subunit KdpB [Candidatus Kapabacteria bacterium]